VVIDEADMSPVAGMPVTFLATTMAEGDLPPLATGG
jgi:hypothetical protein